MKPITAEWVRKAEGDLEAALKTYRARKIPVYDLPSLLKLILPVEPSWLALQPRLDALNKFAVVYRYPGNDATKADAKQAVEDCREVRRAIRQVFGLPT